MDKHSSEQEVAALFSQLAPLENVNIRRSRKKEINTCVILFKSKEDARRVYEFVSTARSTQFAGIEVSYRYKHKEEVAGHNTLSYGPTFTLQTQENAQDLVSRQHRGEIGNVDYHNRR